MPRISPARFMVFCLSAALAACGGGGASDSAATATATAPTTGSSTCLPTQANFDALVIGQAYPAAAKAMGCEATLLSEVSTGGLTQRTYAWGQVSMGPYVNAVFSGGVLSIKLAQRLGNDAATSACLPSRATFDSLKVGMDYAGASAAMGCSGHLLNDAVSSGLSQKSYDWGNVVDGPYVLVKFGNGLLETKLAQRLDSK